MATVDFVPWLTSYTVENQGGLRSARIYWITSTATPGYLHDVTITSGVEISLQASLTHCVWTPLPPYRPRDDGDDDDEHDCGDRPIDVKIDAVYESAFYTALLVSDGQASTTDGFTRLPLLLSRLPGPLRQQLLDFLTANSTRRRCRWNIPRHC